MVIVALFIITKNWKQPTCPSTGEQMHFGTFPQCNTIQKEKGTTKFAQIYG